uniref:Uncharacterized protein LOC111109953 isoform X2 n=1 Tax=Crassostrea virginica TaxID=6565 RepID=A0A8B8BG05_CRAVI|nr:uncharacterized protein LOC111109953 isoform X2 [Crassostrea virginica]
MDMNFRLCFLFLLEFFMFIEQQNAQDSAGEYLFSYDNEELPSPILKKAINNLVGIRMMCRIHPKNCPGAYRKRTSDLSDIRTDQIAESLAGSESSNQGALWSLSGLLTALNRLQRNRFHYTDDNI